MVVVVVVVVVGLCRSTRKYPDGVVCDEIHCMSTTVILMLKGQNQIAKNVEVNRAVKNLSSHHAVVLQTKVVMDHKVAAEDRGVKSLMPH